ncbi:UNVERIFIED_CONTAM: hypothetical protein HDU68_003694 [Siphonaria sp. JEL0065]|nr:hypothetical protein HDU68_003694 [Siphonaria sp. JEL0065]
MLARTLRTGLIPAVQRLSRFVPVRHFNSPFGQQWGGNSGRSSIGSGANRVPPVNTIIMFVPQASVYVVERFGKFHKILEPGLAILIPFIDRIKYVQSLKENAVEIPTQSAITHDNVTLEIDGVLYYKIEDAYKASYGVENAEFAVSQLAQTTMRAEIGQLTLDRTLAERTQLNHNIVNAINTAAFDWGIRCLRYEIRDVHPPENVVSSMHQQVSAERRKRAEILESEGQRQAAINVAEGRKQSLILESEAEKATQINLAEGEAESIKLKAIASAQAIVEVSNAIKTHGSSAHDAISLSIAEQYISSFGKIAKEGTTVVVPSNVGDAHTMRFTQLASLVARQRPAARLQSVRFSHGLVVPYTHTGVAPFANGVPAEQVRELHPIEKKWDFWTSSDAFLGVRPSVGGFTQVPFGEVWVLENGSVLKEGSHFLAPFTKVRAVKNVHTISFGVVSPALKSQDGVSVNAYAVVYIKVTDVAKSALYVDPESNNFDSERAAAKIVKRTLEQNVSSIQVGNSGSLLDSAASSLAAKVESALKAKEGEYGISVEGVEIRGAFPTHLNIPDKLRALDPPLLLEHQAGHGLSADYWTDVLTPAFFQKYKYGNRKEVVTPAAVSLEWSIPSPPDYHHFNELPRQTGEAPSSSGKIAAAH